MGALFSAGCCIPAVLHLVYMRIKILKINWIRKWGIGVRDDDKQALTQDTEEAAEMTKRIRQYLINSEALLFFACAACILVLGELNFFSVQVNWQSEPMSAVGKRFSSVTFARLLTILVAFLGQWATIIGSFFAAAGALYIGKGEEKGVAETKKEAPEFLNDPSVRQEHRDRSPASSQNVPTGGAIDESNIPSNDPRRISTGAVVVSPPPADITTDEALHLGDRTTTWKALGDHLNTPAADRFDNSAWRRGGGNKYPKLHGEQLLNPEYYDTKARYNTSSGSRDRSRPASARSVSPGHGNAPRETSTASGAPSPRRATLSAERISAEQIQTALHQTSSLDVPSPTRRGSVSSRKSGNL
jgi:hypothetical protein